MLLDLLGSIRQPVALARLWSGREGFAFHACDLLACIGSTSAEECILS